TINVAPGEYQAFSVVGKSGLSIIGAGRDQTFVAPTSLITAGVGHKYTANMKSVVFVNDSTDVSFHGMTFQSNSDTPGAGGADAIVFWNASTGAIHDSAIEGLYSISGVQTGQGLAVDAGAGQTTDLTLINCDVSGFQKNGIDIVDGNATISNAGTITFNMNGGSVSGAGPISTIAQNGVMFWNRGGGNLGGTIDGVRLTGFDYAPDPDTASGFLNYGAGTAGNLSITGCNFADNEIHIFDNDGDKVNIEELLAVNTFDKAAIVEEGDAIYGAIQPAIDDAENGTLIHVLPGTYVENLYIDKDVEILGADASSTIIQSPDTLPVCFSTSYDYRAIVCIEDADVQLDGLSFDGLGKGDANNRFVGVAFYNSGGILQNSEVLNIEDTPFSGTQHGLGVYGYFDDGERHLLSITDNTVQDFQKNGITVNSYDNTPVILDIIGNTVIGKGATTTTAQNGIQTLGYSAIATIKDNVIRDIAYDNTDASTKWVATSILHYYGDVTIENNLISGGHVGVYNNDAPAKINNNVFSIEKVGLYAYGIIATDPPNVVPAGVGVAEEDRAGAPADRQTALKVEIKDNEITFIGDENTDTFGIEADSGYGPENLSVLMSGNIIDSFDYGISIYKGTSDPGVFTDVTAIDNCIYNSFSYGLWSNDDSITVNALNNFWGHATGPYHAILNPLGKGGAVSDSGVDFDPWSRVCSKSVPKYELNIFIPLFIGN
ncbi:MAG: hypothetical protein SVR81_10305, partial [Chloroflexota bacterium]|nr:hypothetical protein [Chloroflexota bacterium]